MTTELIHKVEESKLVHKTEGFFAEFWKFAARGNVMDLAIGVILGTAFGAIVNSLVQDVVMPIFSLATGNINLNTYSYTLRGPVPKPDGTLQDPVVIAYGHLLQNTLTFLIIAFSIFIMFRLVSKLRDRLKKKEEQEQQAAPPTPVSTQEKLLCEIRDLMKIQVGQTDKK